MYFINIAKTIISLSIKKAEERKQKNYTAPAKIDNSFVWTETKNEGSFEDMMNKFKQVSDEKFSDLKRKNPDAKKNRRSGQK